MDISNIDRILALCREQQKKQGVENAGVTFRLPRRSNRSVVKLFGNRGPSGILVSVEPDATFCVAKFPAHLVIKFLERERALELSRQIDVAKRVAKGGGR